MAEEITEHSLEPINYQSKEQLVMAYMPFIKTGALFIETKKNILVGDIVRVQINVLNETDTHFLEGPVVWVTPTGAQSGMLPGIGVAFSEEMSGLKSKIEGHLAGVNQQNLSTLTM